MARSKSKHMRLIMRRRKQHNQRMKRRKADAKTQGAAAPARKAPARKATYIVQFKAGVSEAQALALVRSHGGHVLNRLPIIHGLAVRASAHAALLLAHNYAVKGVTLFTTSNAEQNAPMRAINRKLGFEPIGEHVILGRDL